MSAYIVFIRNKTHDPAGLEKYGALARLSPAGKMKILAAKTNRYQVLEGAPAEAVVIMEFPSMSDALEWYNSEAYQKALPYRKAAGEYQGFLVEGSS